MNKLGVALIALIFSSGALAVKVTFTSELHEVTIERLCENLGFSEAGTSDENTATPFATIEPNVVSDPFDLKVFEELVFRYKLNNVYKPMNLFNYINYDKIAVTFLSDGSHNITICNNRDGCTSVEGFNHFLKSPQGRALLFPHADKEFLSKIATLSAYLGKDKEKL